jgi:aspartate-semialdehyde dehydrogenase
MEPEVPLVVPEINSPLVTALATESGGQGGIIANPNCSTIQIALALAPLHQVFGLREAHVTTLQAVSGAGQKALNQLQAELDHQSVPQTGQESVFPCPIAGNVFPEIGPALPDGSFEEETKVIRELRKILNLEGLQVTCTATRTAIRHGHSAAVRVLCDQPVTPRAAAAAMAAWPGLSVEKDPHEYKTPLEVAGGTTVHVGRLRQDPNRDNALLFWVVADNLHKGAAWNAIQIADLLFGGSSWKPKPES